MERLPISSVFRGQVSPRDRDVVEARYVAAYTVWLRFRDGRSGEIDLGAHLEGEIFEPLRDVARFRRCYVHPESCTLAWAGGADFAPEFLYARVTSTRRSRVGSFGSDVARRFAAVRGRLVGLVAPRSPSVWPVPEISRFFGIVIHMFRADHAPPHFHAIYGDFALTMTIQTGESRGDFPPRALRFVREWTELHRAELLANWQLASDARPLRPIAPLE